MLHLWIRSFFIGLEGLLAFAFLAYAVLACAALPYAPGEVQIIGAVLSGGAFVNLVSLLLLLSFSSSGSRDSTTYLSIP